MGVKLIVPWLVGGAWRAVTATIKDGVWKSSSSALIRVLRLLHLDEGHHADRDLELAQMAAKIFAGSVKDNRRK